MKTVLHPVTLCVLVICNSAELVGQELPKSITDARAGEMRLIPAGEALMGTPDSELDGGKDEKPQLKVPITDKFYLGVFEVTVEQFGQFVTETGYVTDAERHDLGGWGVNRQTKSFARQKTYTWREPGYPQEPKHPVVDVSWTDARAYCTWLTQKDGTYRFRLPKEVEWEWACRAGTNTRWSSGNESDTLREAANVADASLTSEFPKLATESSTWNDGFAFAAPVGSLKPNRAGIHDMHGNVAEWCEDTYVADIYRKPAALAAAKPGGEKCFRGGAWNFGPKYARSAQRNKILFSDSWCNVGFRVLREVAPNTKQPDAIELVPLVRFYDENKHEHVYSYGDGEPAAWRKRREMKSEKVIGYASLHEIPGTTRLYRYLMPDGRHKFFTKVTKVPEGASIEGGFTLFVWPNRARDGMSGIHASAAPDGFDMIFDYDKKYLDNFADSTKKGIGVQRRYYGLAFYLMKEPGQ